LDTALVDGLCGVTYQVVPKPVPGTITEK
jgi:hypothetical protein